MGIGMRVMRGSITNYQLPITNYQMTNNKPVIRYLRDKALLGTEDD
ncbi:hypothetical protein NIES37_60260 [Tolypothrix tenuis PCC 7101]|uniref:Uncharacterized protein n=1 Tax=Tolypothrix tenuis PCC 7101 TaxID=231146 RepID=A0A1Z4N8G2_9CYAN|nr:hypothetical protein NIES37_60260 [Tolypothrix tenuis PCC 7101]